ncbi:hypothetical protein AAF712_010998 [Marasmius tenuissimus]|uniref:Uncharacterized protein n=1 Tax=Marasmius tenuissimus TaxID=585030 RepID=A0ABR2ZKQ7_9AGAR
MSVLRKLCSKATQWTSVTLRLHKVSFESFLDYRGKFLNITNLHLRFEIGAMGEWEESVEWQKEYGYLAGLFRDTRKLRRLIISGDYAPMPYIIPEIPWKNILHFSARNVSTNGTLEESFYEVLSLLENVEGCHLAAPSFEQKVPIGSITLPRLHSLVVSVEVGGLDLLAGSLVTPMLRSLAFEKCISLQFEPIQHLVDRSSCHLDRLCFDTLTAFYLDGLVAFLRSRQVSSVSKLELSWDVLCSPDFLEALRLSLSDNSERTHVLPHLTALEIVGDEDSGIQIMGSKSLIDTLASRRNISGLPPGSVSRLETFTIRGNEDSFRWEDEAASLRFSELCRGGLIYSRVLLK